MINIIKANIKFQLKIRNKTIQNLCKQLGRKRSYIYLMTDNVSAIKIIQIAHAIGCEPSDLFKDL